MSRLLRPLLGAVVLAVAAYVPFACSVGDELDIPDGGYLDPNLPDPDPPGDEPDEGEGNDGIDPNMEGTKGDAGPDDAMAPSDASDPPDDTPEPPVPEPPGMPPAEPPGPDASVALDASLPPDDVTPSDAGAPVDIPSLSSPAPRRISVVFSRRPTSNAPDTAIEDALIGLIDHAARGSRIRVAMYYFTAYRFSAALLNAARMRQVDVRVVLDGHNRTAQGSELARLQNGLGADRVTVCGAPGTSCVGTGIQHNKFVVFSALDDGSTNVVAVTSHNFTAHQRRMHNNLVVVRNDVGLARAYDRNFDLLRRDERIANPYRFEDGDLDQTRAYFFPRTDGGDTVVSVLENVRCDASSRVRVAMAFFTNRRLEVAEALAALRRDGCSVSVVVGDASIPVGTRVLSTLRGAGIRVTRYPRRTGPWGLHSKYLLIDAPYADSGSRHRTLVFTGSHNYTGGALTANDENMLRVEDASVFNAFLADWVRVRDAAQRP